MENNIAFEIASVILSQKTINKLDTYIKSSQEFEAFEEYDMTFRFSNSRKGIYNLDLLCTTNIDENHISTYLRPLGFYEYNDNRVEFTVLKEYESVVIEEHTKSKINSLKIKTLDIKLNAIIAAYSINAFIQARKMRDSHFIANGLEMDVFISFQGDPQIFIDDKYGLNLGICTYYSETGGFRVPPVKSLEQEYDLLESLQLFSLFKILV